jgi:hypothetical protein
MRASATSAVVTRALVIAVSTSPTSRLTVIWAVICRSTANGSLNLEPGSSAVMA